MKSDFIKNLEKEGELFSVVKVPSFKEGKKYFDNKKVEMVFSISTTDSKGNMLHEEIIYKTPQNFYLECKLDKETECTLTIYYKVSQLNELKFYLNQLHKNK